MSINRRLSTHPIKTLLTITLLAGTIASCTPSEVTQIASTIPSTAPTLPASSATTTPTPVQPKIIFLDSDQLPKTLSQAISTTLFELAQSQGYQFITSFERPIEQLDPATRVVVILPPDPGIQTISNEHPDIQFIAIGIPNLLPSANLSLIGSEGFREDRIAFIAGYISAVLTKDWRIGIINQASSEWKDPIHQSFRNGLVYYCGICQLTYPPYFDYPILTTLSDTASTTEWQNAADLLLSQAVETVFIYSNQFDISTLEYLSQDKITFIGTISPPDTLYSSWISTIRMAPETIIQAHWDDVMNQNGGWIEEIPIILENVNEELFSRGRQQWIQEFLDDVIQGYIETGSDVITGSE